MMTSHHYPEQFSSGGYFVRSPRATDALGQSLRDAYDRRRHMPDDIADAMKALDRIPALH